MNKKIFSMIGLLSMMVVLPSCEKNNNVRNDNVDNQTRLMHDNVNGNTKTNATNTTVEEEYVADESKRVTIKLNVTLPNVAISNDVYVIGDFNNWGMYNSLNDSTYKVVNGSVSISNVEANTDYSYMFVQKIAGATYTYNFSQDNVDSEGNQVIGYTSDGKLISQYCISQTNDKFTVKAVSNGSATNTVTSWKEAVYGGNFDVVDKYDEPTAGFHLYVTPFNKDDRPYYIALERDPSKSSEVFAIGVKLSRYDSVMIYHADTYTLWGEDNIEPYGAYREFVSDPDYGMICWVEEGEYDFYVKLSSGNDSIYVGKTGETPDDSVTSEFSYSLHITDINGEERFVSLAPAGQDPGGKDQSFGDNVELNAGDVIQIHNNKTNISWVEKNLELYGEYNKFTVTNSGIRCNVAGTYDIYLKTQMDNNSIYIGPAN